MCHCHTSDIHPWCRSQRAQANPRPVHAGSLRRAVVRVAACRFRSRWRSTGGLHSLPCRCRSAAQRGRDGTVFGSSSCANTSSCERSAAFRSAGSNDQPAPTSPPCHVADQKWPHTRPNLTKLDQTRPDVTGNWSKSWQTSPNSPTFGVFVWDVPEFTQALVEFTPESPNIATTCPKDLNQKWLAGTNWSDSCRFWPRSLMSRILVTWPNSARTSDNDMARVSSFCVESKIFRAHHHRGGSKTESGCLAQKLQVLLCTCFVLVWHMLED